MDKLTLSDIDILIEALSAWESNTKELLGDMVMNLMIGKEGRDRPEFKLAEESRKAKSEVEKTTRIEAPIMLKAKLINMKTQAFTDTL